LKSGACDLISFAGIPYQSPDGDRDQGFSLRIFSGRNIGYNLGKVNKFILN